MWKKKKETEERSSYNDNSVLVYIGFDVLDMFYFM